MVVLYRYIFTKAYFFCINIFNEKEFPQYFASGVVTLAMVTNIIILLELIEYFSFPIRVNIYSEYHGYFALFSWGIVLFYVNYKKRYLKVLEHNRNISVKKKKNLKIISITYLLFLFVAFFLLGALIREYNINHPN